MATKHFLKQLKFYFAFGALGLAVLWFAFFKQPNQHPTATKPAGPPAPPPPSVTASKPVVKKLIEWKEYTARLDANADVEIRARVSGYLESVHFAEGQLVKEGDLLFTIDQRPFQAEVDHAKAALALAQAASDLTKTNLHRAKSLVTENAIAKEEYDSRKSQADQAQANVQLAEAALTTAELNLSFTEIRSPISGIAGEHLINKGNLITGGTSDPTLLTTVVPQNPIYAYFDLDEASQLANLRRQYRGELPSRAEGGLPVEMQLSDETGFPHKGTIDFIDNRLSAKTATLRIRGKFDNSDGLLTPGLFARIRVQASPEYEALLIPDSSIGTSQSVKYVWLVGANNEAHQQEIVLGPLYEDRRIVRSGLDPKDTIVVNGIQLVRPGSPLNVAMEETNTWDSGEKAVALK